MSQYATVAEADDYFMYERLENSVWLRTDNNKKNRALIEASRLIDRLNFIGSKADDAQALEFPRGVDTEVPVAIQYACYECAYALLDDVNPELEMNLLNQDQMTFNELRSKHDRSFALEHVAHGIPSAVAWTYLKPYLRQANQIQFERG